MAKASPQPESAPERHARAPVRASGPRSPACSAGERVRVRGIVQGVGFRPTVWRLARDCGLDGEVWNDADGVGIDIFGPAESRLRFLARLRLEAPPLARIDRVETTRLDLAPPRGFEIVASRAGPARTGVAADIAVCAACLEELRDPADRRHRYPFTNCTHCGPRLTIVRALPYDRERTSMDAFRMCGACRAEYDDPADRRFHAQPNACPDCGPRLELQTHAGAPVPLGERDAIERTAELLGAGRIVAVKGLGGFHVAVDATNEAAVAELRRRKRRGAKPFALMARDSESVHRYCRLTSTERALLESPAAPIVLLRAVGEQLAPSVAPGQRTLGFMLPYTPLHRLLLDELRFPIVLTSGNLSDEPQCTRNSEARRRLSSVADDFLVHDRVIVNRVDDSVARVIDDAPRLLRRARGYAPAALALPDGFAGAPSLLAMGGELKSTFALLRGGEALLSQHLGDLEHEATYRDYVRSVELFASLFDHRPRAFAVDAHPEYLSTKLGLELAERAGAPALRVQHHHAHLASCLADNGVPREAPAVLGIVMDGLGYGEDGTFWGGEFLLGGYAEVARLASLAPVPMLGGARAIREPWRSAYAHLDRAIGWREVAHDHGELELCRDLERRPLAALDAMLARSLNCPLSTSAGRLFDAVAATLGLCRDGIDYEGQAAIELEACVDEAALAAAGDGYPFALTRSGDRLVLDSRPLWPALLEDIARQVPRPLAAAKFHRGFGSAVARVVDALRTGPAGARFECVALSGGVFQNAVLVEDLAGRLRVRGLDVLLQRRVPTNDGGLALGQAAVAAARLLAGPAAAVADPTALADPASGALAGVLADAACTAPAATAAVRSCAPASRRSAPCV